MSTERKLYDDRDGIAYATYTLERLVKLARERNIAGYERKERLQEWVVLGAIAFDTCGNIGLIDKENRREMGTYARAVTMAEFIALPREGSFSYSGSGRVLPDPESKCPVCTRGWSIENWIDSVFVESTAYHKACRLFVREAVNQEYFENAFTAAGYDTRSHNFTRIPNEYWPGACDYGESWFLVQVPFGVIKVGWRKRVIELAWHKANLETQPDFSKEDVTRENRMIHAWGFVKLVEYLTKIREGAPKKEKAAA